ncbi:unnamed protein product [Gongylonema pulchrum]|uniref:SAM-dependent MTase TRM10-type domain-containing protein n=1 Tax=Gongylonema pulchrum TaxID=637853 RepID=A0A3P7MNP8_9BILA|nr:unnamed protein product [Gongylonema pulchrum]
MHIPYAVLPSHRLIRKLENKDMFLRLLLEMEFLYGAEKRLPAHITDGNWMKYMQMPSIIERCCYLCQLYESRKELEENDEQKILRAKESTGAKKPALNTLHYFEREQFRRLTYEMFGSRLLARWRCNDSVPPLLVDCRYLSNLNFTTQTNIIKQIKDLVLENSLQRNPFPIVFVNYHSTSDIALGIVNSWLRKRCLPKYRQLIVDKNDDSQQQQQINHSVEGEESQQRDSAPFVPVVTTATFWIFSEQIAYINPKSEHYLPGPLQQYKAFVFCATPDTNYLNSSFKAARAEKLNSFRLPISQFVNLGKTPVTMPLRITANIIRDVYASDVQWREAFQKHIPYFDVVATDVYRSHENDKNNLQN